MTATHTRTLARRFCFIALSTLLLGSASWPPATAQERDQVAQYVFTVEIEGMTLGKFREVSGLGVETEVVEYRDGSSNDVRKLPGRTKFADIVLKRGFSGDRALYDWATTYARTGAVVRRSGSIVMHDQTHTEVARWNFRNGWPTKYDGPTLNAAANDVAIETLVIAHEGLQLSDDDRR